MKIFRLNWLDGKAQLATGDDIAEAFKNAGYGGGAIRALDWYDEVPSVTFSEIAEQIGISITETIFAFRGLFNNPKLGEGLHEFRHQNPDENRLPADESNTFVKKVKTYLAEGKKIFNPCK